MRRWLDVQLNLKSWPHPGMSPTSWTIIVLILISVVLFTLDSEPELGAAASAWIASLNLLILLIFALEFILRFWSAGEAAGIHGIGARSAYAGRTWLVIDFVAFAPELLLLALMLLFGDQYALSVGALKVVRLLRLLKLAHFIPGGRLLLETVQSVRNELLEYSGPRICGHHPVDNSRFRRRSPRHDL